MIITFEYLLTPRAEVFNSAGILPLNFYRSTLNRCPELYSFRPLNVNFCESGIQKTNRLSLPNSLYIQIIRIVVNLFMFLYFTVRPLGVRCLFMFLYFTVRPLGHRLYFYV